jgi:hypothetical protein
MYESIYKNNEVENEVSSDMSYFWYSDNGLPLGPYVVGDVAYTLSDICITPFTGSQRLKPTKNAYN